ncbi:MAG: glycosyltransferase family 39 protein [Acidobacteriota bacterium]|nr:glycosyltransferase family 39 protein [Acidobacteriota bacterium]
MKTAKSLIDRRLGLAIGAGLLIRTILIAVAWARRGPSGFLVPDSFSYLRLGNRLLAGRGFIDRWDLPEMFRTPGYPLLLSVGSAIDHPVLFALVVQSLMMVGIVALTFSIARSLLHDERLAGICALVVALEPTMLTWSIRVMPETALTLCLVAFAHAALRVLESSHSTWVVTSAVMLCAAAYVKPIAYPLVFIICIASLARPRAALLFVLTCAALLAPWIVRNHRAGYTGFSTLMARAVYVSAGASVVAQREHRPYEDVRQELLRRADVRGPTADPKSYAREGVSLVATDPFAYAKIHVKGMLRTLFDPGATEYLRMFGLYSEGGSAMIASGGGRNTARNYPIAFWSSIALGILLTPLVVLPFIGACRSVAHRSATAAFFLLAIIAAYLVFAGGGVPGRSRFRVPAVPFLVVMSAVAFARRNRV